ncbi:nuclear speckle splicing regulatory protein 1 isoform X1 [Medicago truncatula]|nr:nuclear speckle splicing regulatory protein 1 isoform X1 [Medicago truncatula]
MNEFKSTPGLSSSAPLNMNRDIHCKRADDSEPRISLDSMKKGSRSVNVEEDTNELPLPKSSKQHSHSSSGNIRESHAKEKSDKPRQPKKHSKHSTPNNDSFNNESKLTTTEQSRSMDTDSLQLHGTTNDNLPSKRTYSKKTKDIQGVGGSSKARSKAQHKEPDSGEGTHSRSSSKSKESNSNEGSHSRTGSKSRDPDSKEGPHSRSGSKSKNLNSNEGHPSRHDAKSKSKHRLSEDGQLERESNEDLLRKYTN